jgi:hypothetical protein
MSLLFKTKKRKVKDARLERRARLEFDRLEDRTLLATFTVGAGGNFLTLQAAITAAAAGDDLVILPGGASLGTGTGASAVVGAFAAGSTQITLAANAGYQIGDVVSVTPAGGFQEFLTIKSVDAANKITFTTATRQAFAGGEAVVEQGTGITKQLSISGDPGANRPDLTPVGAANTLFISSGVTGVSISNVDVGFAGGSNLTIDQGSSKNTITNVGVTTLTDNPYPNAKVATTTNGQNTISFSTIGAGLVVNGNTTGTATNDVIANNNITNFAGIGVDLQNADGTSVDQNVITATAGGTGVRIQNGAATTISITRNTINASVDGVAATQPAAATVVSVNVSNNVINTGSAGNGVNLDIFNGVDAGKKFSATVFGNDLRFNKIGLLAKGDNQGADTSAGTINADNSNDFRTFNATQAAGGFFAISLQETGAAAKGALSAKNNIFAAGVDPNAVVQDSDSNAGAVGQGQITVTALSAAQTNVADAYFAYLGRHGTTDEYDFWAPQSNEAIAAGIANSSEAQGFRVDGVYRVLFGRNADSGGKSFWVSFLTTGGTVEDFLVGLLNSSEFQNRLPILGFGFTNQNTVADQFVTALYFVCLGRAPTTDEVAFWLGVAGNQGTGAVAQGIVTSLEFRTRCVSRLYGVGGQPALVNALFPNVLQRLLTPQPSEINFWATTTLNLQQIAIAITASPEFFS